MSSDLDPASMRSAPARPGWPELLAGVGGYTIAFVLSPAVVDIVGGEDGVTRGLAAAALSGIVGLIGFVAAFLIRLRAWTAFGVKGTGLRWILVAIGLGLAVFVAARLVFAMLLATGTLPDADPQQDYRAAAGGGALALAAQLLLIAVLTPVGEEFLFRGVFVSALQSHGAFLSIAASTLLFAVAHGLNLTLLPATLVGVVSAVLLLRTGSIWPGVIVHAVNNGLGTVLEVVVPTMS
ncbi:type II CAAX endopeptidase family protein [Actinomycetospora sp. OC33-EN08]|uniref:Type II CAAX endopeptidase family protein n=1 Tax=Actinomycetospora aurantiaca TaxID=3129233 RepID=A0ABU8MV71_9PSEU